MKKNNRKTAKEKMDSKEAEMSVETFLGPEWTRRWEGDGFKFTYPERYQEKPGGKESTMKLYHYPTQVCPHCQNEKWKIPYYGHNRPCEETYWHPEREMDIPVTADWKCLACGKYVTIETRTGHPAFSRGLFGIQRIANPMYPVSGWGNALFETIMVMSLAIIVLSLLIRVFI